MSPFDGRRFMLREDSATWSSAREPPAGSNKLVRFASTNSVASDKDEPVPPPPPQSPSKRFPFVPATLALIFLGLALWLLPLRIGPFKEALSFVHRCASPSAIHEDGPGLSPALKASIEELVIATIRSQQVADRGLPDYALKANGGRIALPLTSKGHGLSRDDDPSIAIDDNVRAGQCWTIRAHPSQIGLRLSRMLRPSHVSIEHLPRQIVVDPGQAPGNMTLWGLIDGKNNTEIFKNLVASRLSDHPRRAPPITKGFLWAPLASFAYNVYDNDAVQTFPVTQAYVDSGITFGIVVLEVLDNWGGDVTCLYRVMVHGTPA